MKAAHMKMWRTWARDFEPESAGRIYGSPDAAAAARVHAAWMWRHMSWRTFPLVIRSRIDHTADGSPFDPKVYEVTVDVQAVPEFSTDAPRAVG